MRHAAWWCLLGACGTPSEPPAPDAAATAAGSFEVPDQVYPLPYQEAYARAVGTADEALVVIGSGRAAGRCDPTETVECYDLVATGPLGTGARSCASPDVQLSLLIDGGAEVAYLAGGAFGIDCFFTVVEAGAVGEPVRIAGITGTLLRVGDVERTVTIIGGEIAATRGADR